MDKQLSFVRRQKAFRFSSELLLQLVADRFEIPTDSIVVGTGFDVASGSIDLVVHSGKFGPLVEGSCAEVTSMRNKIPI